MIPTSSTLAWSYFGSHLIHHFHHHPRKFMLYHNLLRYTLNCSLACMPQALVYHGSTHESIMTSTERHMLNSNSCNQIKFQDCSVTQLLHDHTPDHTLNIYFHHHLIFSMLSHNLLRYIMTYSFACMLQGLVKDGSTHESIMTKGRARLWAQCISVTKVHFVRISMMHTLFFKLISQVKS